jgi:hypothetical protein
MRMHYAFAGHYELDYNRKLTIHMPVKSGKLICRGLGRDNELHIPPVVILERGRGGEKAKRQNH